MQRIMIIGPGNAGKSTLAVQIGEKLNLPVYHLDKYFWKDNWQQNDTAKWLSKHAELIQQPSWVIEGDFSKLYEERANYADTIIFLNLPLRILLPRFIRRVYMYRGRSRPDMAEGNIERINFDYIRWLYKYDRKKRIELLAANRQSKQTYILKSPREIQEFLKSM